MMDKLILLQIYFIVFSLNGMSQDSLRLKYERTLNSGEVYHEIVVPNYDSLFFKEIDSEYYNHNYGELEFLNLGIENIEVLKDKSGKLNWFKSAQSWILNIQMDTLYTEETLWTKEYLKDSTVLTKSNEYTHYQRFKNDSASFENKFLLFEDSIVVESYLPVQFWGVGETYHFYDRENFRREIYVLKEGLTVRYTFDEVSEGCSNKTVYTIEYLKTGERQVEVYLNMCSSDSNEIERTKLSIETIGSNQLSKFMVNYLVSCYTSGSRLTEPKFLPLLFEYYPSMLEDW